MSQEDTPVSFDEIRALLEHLPEADLEAARAASEREASLTKPAGALGRLEELTRWLATWQALYPPRLERPRVAVFAGNHGVADHGVSAYPAEVTAQMMQTFIEGGAAINQLCAVADSDLRVYEMALESPTEDFTQGPAMSEEDCARAIAYGMMAVEPDLDVLALGEMGIGNTTSASAICHALFGGSASDWVGRGSGLDDEGLARKTRAVEAGIAANRETMTDPLNVLRCLGGQELAAIVGAILAARMARTPVLLDGFSCSAAAAVVYALDPRGLDHCLVAHRSAEQPHGQLLERLRKRPLLDLDMRLGEASGAALAILLLRAALACHKGMASFEEAGVSGRSET